MAAIVTWSFLWILPWLLRAVGVGQESISVFRLVAAAAAL